MRIPRQFWNELNGLAAKCNFGGITESLVKDVFIVKMAKKHVQQKLCTEPKTTVNETIQFAIAYEEGTTRQTSIDKLERPNLKSKATEVNNIWGLTRNASVVRVTSLHNT